MSDSLKKKKKSGNYIFELPLSAPMCQSIVEEHDLNSTEKHN